MTVDVRVQLPGLSALQSQTLGDPGVCVAVLDGPVDLDHPCFTGADLRMLPTVAGGEVGPGTMTLHGTHVTSLVFGQPESPVIGIAPRCRGLVVPVFRDGSEEKASQLDLARAIEQALDEGADVISVSGGERSPTAEAEWMLERAVGRAADAGVLVVAAVGNDGCDCVQVPAAVPSVLAVGACDARGEPLASNNWGEAFQVNGVLAPGHQIAGAAPGGGVRALTGSSFATPIVAATAALLLSTQSAAGRSTKATDVGSAILASAIPCPAPEDDSGCRRHLVGRLSVTGAHELITQRGDRAVNDDPPEAAPVPSLSAAPPPSDVAAAPSGHAHDTVGVTAAGPPQGCSCAGADQGNAAIATTPAPATSPPAPPPAAPSPPTSATSAPPPPAPPPPAPPPAPARPAPGVRAASGDCGCGGEGATGLVYAVGVIGYDFGTEARRDGFRQAMGRHVVPPPPDEEPEEGYDYLAPANPYDPHQLSAYLARNPWVSDKVIWTLNIDRSTPIYALEAETPVGMVWDGYNTLEPDPTDPDQNEKNFRDDLRHPDKLAQILENFAAYPPVSYIHRTFRDAVVGQVRKTDPDFVSRVSIPGVLTNRTVRLFSGQVVPVVQVKSRGIHMWNETALANAAIAEVEKDPGFQRALRLAGRESDEDREREREKLDKNVRAFLDKVYYQFRNLGQTSADRALNYAGTNAFAVASDFAKGMTSGTYVPGNDEHPLYSLDTISVTKSPYCRPDSDCWDVRITFFDPANDRAARVTYLYTYDVSDAYPVSLAPVHQFLGN